MKPTRPLMRRITLVAATATSTLVLAACGSNSGGDGRPGHASATKPASSPSAQAPAGTHNAADVAFAKGMIPHHRQAVEMADLAVTRAASRQVKALAEKIKKAQEPEIKTMSGWLTAWDEQVPEEMPGMDHSAHSQMPGMKGMKEMDALRKKSGKDFDASFLEMMIGHHRGAVQMAGTEKDKGAYGRAKTLAADIIKAQNAEITQMNKLLGKR
ncbi:Uncharacterized conserved protein, DUF305 family [Streptomyces sp. 2112.3]|uniref:DUF305 domain-containing protein n=1 Tax=Streptomyces sp. 2112.3 TaxID=1881023 RepID=UPI0008956AC9|nr:DUF305 domain-containing protein [Streptomyces sp. 2112.3]SEF18001.1 Uncharacterized conserved protein, DUF305 family [Streptomyces sp. 2112.3]